MNISKEKIQKNKQREDEKRNLYKKNPIAIREKMKSHLIILYFGVSIIFALALYSKGRKSQLSPLNYDHSIVPSFFSLPPRKRTKKREKKMIKLTVFVQLTQRNIFCKI